MEKTKITDEMTSISEVNKALLHCNWANRRMLIALICVCLTFIITIIVFVTGYTAREKNWLDLVKELKKTPVTEVYNGQTTD